MFSEASLSAAVRPAPPAPSSRTFAPLNSNPRSSRRARVIASASVLNPCDRVSSWNLRKLPQRSPGTALIPALEADGIDRAPALGGFVQDIHHIHGQQLVRDGEVEADEVHRLCALDGRAEIIRVHLERQVAPVKSERSDAGILHRGRRGMFDGMAVHRANARAGINWLCERPGHALVIGKRGPSSKSKMRDRLSPCESLHRIQPICLSPEPRG